MPTFVWIVIWVAVLCLLAFLALRERRSGRKVAPDAVKQRREDTFRMNAAREFYDVPKKGQTK
jgi:hypothetical protein